MRRMRVAAAWPLAALYSCLPVSFDLNHYRVEQPVPAAALVELVALRCGDVDQDLRCVPEVLR